MLKPSQNEEQFVTNINISLSIELPLHKAVGDMIQLHAIARKFTETKELKIEELNRRFDGFGKHFDQFFGKLKEHGVSRFPELIFADISQAITWTMVRIRAALPPMKVEDDPITIFHQAFTEFKCLVWPDSRAFNHGDISDEQVFEKLGESVKAMKKAASRIKTALLSYSSELSLNREPRKATVEAELCAEDRKTLFTIESKSVEAERIARQLNNRDRRDHGLKPEFSAPPSEEDILKCDELWAGCKLHPEWLDIDNGKRVTLAPAFKYLAKIGKLPPTIHSLDEFKKALDYARKLKRKESTKR